MTLAPAIDSPPDWSQPTVELCCPLCEYNLRGLTEPRCPECGFAFSWAELIQGQREGHKYLFEHHPKRNAWSFWKTYWSDWQAARFWMDVNPAQPVRLRRLMIFWLLSALPLIAIIILPFSWNLWHVLNLPVAPTTVTTLGSYYYVTPMRPPMPPSALPTFLDNVQHAWDMTVGDLEKSTLVPGALEVLAWPWLTLIFLMVFSESMRRAKVKKRHVLRAIVYGCDYYLLAIPVILLCQLDGKLCDAVLYLALACGSIALYRLYFAYSRYLRFHLPFATVLSSQISVFLVALIVYFHTYSYW